MIMTDKECSQCGEGKCEWGTWECPECGDVCSDPECIVTTTCHEGHNVVLGRVGQHSNRSARLQK